MKKQIQNFLHDMLVKQYGEEITKKIEEGYSDLKPVTLRVNSIKSDIQKIKNIFDEAKIIYKEVPWYKDALIIENIREDEVKEMDIFQNGEIYLQSLSSMIPPIVLDAKPGENLLDMAAAPGGKTTQIAALSNNSVMITACEKNKIRAERLKYNLNKQGASRASVMIQDARRLDDYFSFDRILLDAPCSGSGTDNIYSKNFGSDLVERSVKFQIELLQKAIKLLKPGKEMIYSTCSILSKENENVVNEFLKLVDVIPIDKEILSDEKISFLPVSIDGTICVCPSKNYEGFFIAKLRKKG